MELKSARSQVSTESERNQEHSQEGIWGWEATKGMRRGDQIPSLLIRRHQRSSEQVQESDFMGQCQTRAGSNRWRGKRMDFCVSTTCGCTYGMAFYHSGGVSDQMADLVGVILQAYELGHNSLWQKRNDPNPYNRLERTCYDPGKEHSIFNNNQKALPSNDM